MKVYMSPDSNDAGVTVEDYGASVSIGVASRPEWADPIEFTDPEARAVVEGLLRRMLERDGTAAAHLFVADVWDRWNRSEGR